MKKITVAMAMLFVLTAAIACTYAAAAQSGQNDLLPRLAGKWMFEARVLGAGFISSTFPSATTPPKEILRAGQKISFVARLQTGQGSYGEPVNEDFNFALEKGADQDYLLSVESKSWLNLKQQKLVGNGSALKGETKLSLSGSDMSLTISIELTQPTGHKWDFTLKDSNGKPKRWYRLTFKPPQL